MRESSCAGHPSRQPAVKVQDVETAVAAPTLW
jgi:hypothetical protein